MKNLIALIFLLVGFLAKAQEAKPILRVVGNSELSVKPTRTVISLTISSIDPTYAGSVEKLITRVDLLTKVLNDLKFKDEKIITSNFRVSKNTKYSNGTRTDDGFIAIQTLKVRFEQDKERLLEVLSKTTSSKADPIIDINFELDNDRKAKLKRKLIKLAVIDAKRKSEIIVTESGYKIAGVKEIIYSRNNDRSDDIFMMAEMEELTVDLDIEITSFEAANLTFSDNVTIVYFIEKR